MPIHIQLAQEAEAQKSTIEKNRNLPNELMEQVKKEGLVKAWAAKTVGGQEAAVSKVTQTIREVAYYNGSLAWVIGVTGCSSLFSGFLEEEKAKDLFAHPNAMIGGYAGPAGIATRVKDGLIVSGHWMWGSGITHCSHIVGGVKIMDGDDFKGTAIVFFKPEEIEMIDNWHVLGLKGTHSIDYKAKEVLIPDARWSSFPVPKPKVESPLYRFSFLGALSLSVSSVALGLANRALTELKNLAKTKRPFGQGKALNKRAEIQQKTGQIEGQYQAAVALFERTISQAEKEVEEGECSLSTKAQIRLTSAYTTSLSHSVVQACFNLAGGSAVWQSHKLEELIRDINVVKQHGMVNDLNYRTVGAVLLEQDVPPFLL